MPPPPLHLLQRLIFDAYTHELLLCYIRQRCNMLRRCRQMLFTFFYAMPPRCFDACRAVFR